MRTCLARCSAALVLFGWVWFAAPPLRASPLRIVPGELQSGRIYVPCLFDGVAQSCVLDTGSVLSLVTGGRPFDKYPAKGKLSYKGASGLPKQSDQIIVRRLELDGVAFPDVKLARANAGDHFETTIGMNLLGNKAFALSFGAKPSLKLDAKPPEGPLSKLKVYKSGLLSVPVTVGEEPVSALWDTGAELSAVDQKYATAHPRDFSFVKEVTNGVDGTHRPIKMRLYKVRALRIGGRAFQNVKVVAINFSSLREGADQEARMVVGFNLVRKASWFFDVPNRLWSVR